MAKRLAHVIAVAPGPLGGTILRNRVYLGDAVHKGNAYPGEHAPILDPELWHRVAERLSAHRRKHGGNGTRGANLLAGLLFDDRHHPMVPTHDHLMKELQNQGVKSKQWQTAKGNVRGGSVLCRGALYSITSTR
jgi:hypothetical protein